MTIKQLLPQVILQESSQQNRWPFCEDTLGCQVFFFHLSLSPEVGVYKVGLIDESSVDFLHLVSVWKSGEDVRKKKRDLDREGEVLCKLLPRKQAVLRKKEWGCER